MMHSALYVDYRHDFFRICVFIAGNAVLANLLPRSCRLDRFPKLQRIYCYFIDLVAGFACNWRSELPSLGVEFKDFTNRQNQPFNKVKACPKP